MWAERNGKFCLIKMHHYLELFSKTLFAISGANKACWCWSLSNWYESRDPQQTKSTWSSEQGEILHWICVAKINMISVLEIILHKAVAVFAFNRGKSLSQLHFYNFVKICFKQHSIQHPNCGMVPIFRQFTIQTFR